MHQEIKEDREAAIEEYRSLRAEILTRLRVQQKLTELGLLLYTTLLLVIAYFLSNDRVATGNAMALSTVLLAAALPFGVLLWAYQEQNVFIALIGSYLNTYIKPLLGIHWEDFLVERRKLFHDIVTHSRFTFLLVAAITPVATAVLITFNFGQAFSAIGWLLFFVNIAILLGALWVRTRTVKSFKAI